MRRKEIEETLSAVANRLYRIGDSESAHHSTTTSTETVGEEIQRLSFLIDKCVAALKTKECDSQQTTNTARDEICACKFGAMLLYLKGIVNDEDLVFCSKCGRKLSPVG